MQLECGECIQFTLDTQPRSAVDYTGSIADMLRSAGPSTFAMLLVCSETCIQMKGDHISPSTADTPAGLSKTHCAGKPFKRPLLWLKPTAHQLCSREYYSHVTSFNKGLLFPGKSARKETRSPRSCTRRVLPYCPCIHVCNTGFSYTVESVETLASAMKSNCPCTCTQVSLGQRAINNNMLGARGLYMYRTSMHTLTYTHMHTIHMCTYTNLHTTVYMHLVWGTVYMYSIRP